MKPLQRNGWNIYFHKIFEEQYTDLKEKIKKLQTKLDNHQLRLHSDVKLFQAIVMLIDETIPYNPFADYFILKGSLKRYSRVKKKRIA